MFLEKQLCFPIARRKDVSFHIWIQSTLSLLRDFIISFISSRSLTAQLLKQGKLFYGKPVGKTHMHNCLKTGKREMVTQNLFFVFSSHTAYFLNNLAIKLVI